ncbi:MAG: signal peptide peptidase SppA [Myxococcota bacterium]
MLAHALVASLLIAVPTPPRLTADVSDAYALYVNPAGLNFLEGAELRSVFARDVTGNAVDLGFYGAAKLGRHFGFGVGLEWDGIGQSAQFTPTIGFAFGGETVAIGAAWNGANRTFSDTWTLGATWRPLRPLSISLASFDVGEQQGPRTFDIGLAFRLFSDRALLSGRWRLIRGQPINSDGDRPDIQLLAKVEPLSGLTVGFVTDLHFRPSLEIGLSIEHFLMSGTAARLDDGVHAFSGELAVTTRALPALLSMPRVAVLELTGKATSAGDFDPMTWRFHSALYGGAPLLIDALGRANDVSGLVLKIGPLELGWAKLEELAAAIKAFRARGKRVDCVLSAATDAELYLASACQSAAVLSSLPVELNGVSASFLFLGEGLDNLGVRPEVIARGAYKSAPEMFTRSGMSAPQREATDALLDATYGTLISGIAEGRGLSADTVKGLTDIGTFTSSEAKSRGLVDAALFPDQVEEWLDDNYGERVLFVDAADVDAPTRSPWGHPKRIALIGIDATIMSGESVDLPFGLGRETGSETVVKALEAARRDPTVVAIVLRVDSPGGDAVASDVIARKVKMVAKEKPVLASFGDVAASGGYYVAAPAHPIFAEKTTITGSIGIFSLGFSVEPLLNKLGIHTEVLERGAVASRGTLLRDWTDAERQATEKEIDGLYQRFLDVVADGRGMKVEAVRAVAEGRVWSGGDAKERGLVDEIGGLDAAIARAKKEGGIEPGDPMEVIVLPESRPSLPELAASMLAPADPTGGNASVIPHVLQPLAQAAARLYRLAATRGAVALMPYVVNID